MVSSGFFQWERLGSGKTWSELHIHYKSLLKRVYNHAGCTKYWNYVTVVPKLIDVIDKKQTYHNVITRKKIYLKSGTVLHQCFWRVLMSVLCLVMHILCLFALKPLSDFFWLFLGQGPDFLMNTAWQPCCSNNHKCCCILGLRLASAGLLWSVV